MANKKNINNYIDEGEKELHEMVSAFASVTKDAINKTTKTVNINTIYCTHCGTKITKDAKYCKNCGKKTK